MPELANTLPRGCALHEHGVESALSAGGFGLTYLATGANPGVKAALEEYLLTDFTARVENGRAPSSSGNAAGSFQRSLR